MAKGFDGFPGQAEGKGNANVIGSDFEPGEAPPADPLNLPDAKPVDPGIEPTFDHATGLPVIPAEQASEHTPFEDDDFPENVPDFLDFLL